MTVTFGPLWRLQPLQRHDHGDGDGDGDGDSDGDGDGDAGAEDDDDDADDDADDDVYHGCYDGCRMHEHTHFFLLGCRPQLLFRTLSRPCFKAPVSNLSTVRSC